MSTKTLHKRIALVAVSALGFGLMSTMPANAAAGDQIATYSAPSTYTVNSAAATLGAAANIGTITLTKAQAAGPLTTATTTLTLSANSRVAVTAAAITSDVATVTTTSAHAFVVGETVTIEGLTATAPALATNFNGDRVITSVPSTTTFTYSIDVADQAAAIAGGDDFVTLKRDLDFFNNVSVNLTPAGSSTSAAVANAVTNSTVVASMPTVVMTPASASFTSASGSATLIAGAALPATATGGKVKYTLSVAGSDTAIKVALPDAEVKEAEAGVITTVGIEATTVEFVTALATAALVLEPAGVRFTETLLKKSRSLLSVTKSSPPAIAAAWSATSMEYVKVVVLGTEVMTRSPLKFVASAGAVAVRPSMVTVSPTTNA